MSQVKHKTSRKHIWALDGCMQLRKKKYQFNFDFSLPYGISIILGPSGCGKTTFLRCVTGLERRVSGDLHMFGSPLMNRQQRINIPIHKRGIAVVFQDPYLFPHLSVQQNLLFAYKPRSSGVASLNWQDVAASLGIEALLKKDNVNVLSGGEKQRLCLGQALISQPSFLCLDEPVSSLDHGNKMRILNRLSFWQKKLSLSMIYVTHSMEEATALGGKIFYHHQLWQFENFIEHQSD